MNIQVKLFAVAKQIAKADTFQIETSEPIRIAEVRERLLEAFPGLRDVLPHVRFAVNASYVGEDTVVSYEDEVAVIPPVSGG